MQPASEREQYPGDYENQVVDIYGKRGGIQTYYRDGVGVCTQVRVRVRVDAAEVGDW